MKRMDSEVTRAQAIMNPIIARFTDAPWTRRQLVQGLGFGALGLGLPELLQIQAARARRVKSCIILWLFGGPSQALVDRTVFAVDRQQRGPSVADGPHQQIAGADDRLLVRQ